MEPALLGLLIGVFGVLGLILIPFIIAAIIFCPEFRPKFLKATLFLSISGLLYGRVLIAYGQYIHNLGLVGRGAKINLALLLPTLFLAMLGEICYEPPPYQR